MSIPSFSLLPSDNTLFIVKINYCLKISGNLTFCQVILSNGQTIKTDLTQQQVNDFYQRKAVLVKLDQKEELDLIKKNILMEESVLTNEAKAQWSVFAIDDKF